MELVIKPIIRVGNSAGVLVPKNWINGRAKVELIAEPINIKKDIFDILEPYLADIVGIYLTGSYARGEETKRSDVDVLVITQKISKKIKKEKYDILLITKNEIKDIIKNNALPLLPMLKEARAIINEEYLKSVKNQQITRRNIQWNIGMIKSALNINKTIIELKKEYSEYVGDSVAYSLILNLRSVYIIDCLKNNKKWSTKSFLSLIKKISGNLKAYDGYLRIKNDERSRESFPIKEAEKLLNYVSEKLKKYEKWLRAKKE